MALVAIGVAIGLHIVAVWGMSLIPERPAPCPPMARRCEARCDGRTLEAPARCPALPDCRCELLVYEDLLPPPLPVVPPPVVVAEAGPEPEAIVEPEAVAEPETEPEAAPEPKAGPEPAVTKEQLAKLRTVGVARVLGTYGTEGSALEDVLGSTENNLDSVLSQAIVDARIDGGDRGGGAADIGGGGQAMGGTAVGVASALGSLDRKRPARIRGHARVSTIAVDGGLDVQAAEAMVRRRAVALRFCYEAALRSQPELAGTVDVAVEVSTMGAVSDVELSHDTVGSDTLSACAPAKISGWRFPAADAVSTVSFTILFERQ